MAATVTAGVDVGGTNTRAVAFAADGSVVADVHRTTNARGGEAVLGSTLAALDDLAVALNGFDRFDVVGVGIPGAVDVGRGTVRHAVNLGIDGASVDLGGRISAAVGAPCHVENDVNAEALGAAAVDPDRAAGGLIYLSVGTGIAAGVILEGRLWRGNRGLAGEIGHVPVDPSGPRCRCGRRGCLEAVASGTAIARRWPVAVGEKAGEALFMAASAGDKGACLVRDEIVAHLARGVELLASAYDVERIVIGGGVAGIGAPLQSALQDALAASAAESPRATDLGLENRVRLAAHDVPFGPLGAALSARETVGVGHGG